MTLDEIAELTAAELKLVNLLKNKSRSEQDQILFELERKLNYGDTIRNDSIRK